MIITVHAYAIFTITRIAIVEPNEFANFRKKEKREEGKYFSNINFVLSKRELSKYLRADRYAILPRSENNLVIRKLIIDDARRSR